MISRIEHLLDIHTMVKLVPYQGQDFETDKTKVLMQEKYSVTPKQSLLGWRNG